MPRREFITLIGGTAAAWPLALHAQPPARSSKADGAILRTDFERDPVASGLGVAVVSKP